MEDEIVEIDDEVFQIVSFEGKGGKDLLHSNGCLFCSTSGLIHCKLVL